MQYAFVKQHILRKVEKNDRDNEGFFNSLCLIIKIINWKFINTCFKIQ